MRILVLLILSPGQADKHTRAKTNLADIGHDFMASPNKPNRGKEHALGDADAPLFTTLPVGHKGPDDLRCWIVARGCHDANPLNDQLVDLHRE